MSALRAGRVALLPLLLLLGSGGALATDAPVAAGAEVFARWCQPCHGAGPGHPGTQALAAKYHGSPPAELEQRTDLTPEIVRYFVRHGISVMAPFRKTEITDEELDALAAWLARR
ncbi:MAG: cytochrome c [Steroidobacteraceae bacterium]